MALDGEQTKLISAIGKEGCYQLVDAYLPPIQPSITLDQKKTLVVKYGSFLARVLKILPIKLLHLSVKKEPIADELFLVYDLCMRYTVKLKNQIKNRNLILDRKSDMFPCFHKWKRWDEGRREAHSVLTSLQLIAPLSDSFLPDVAVKAARDQALKLANTVCFVFQCVSENKSGYSKDYETVQKLANELQPWVGILTENERDDINEQQARHLMNCILAYVRNGRMLNKKFVLAKSLGVIFTSIPGNPHLKELCDSLYQIGVTHMDTEDFTQAQETIKLHLQTSGDVIKEQLKESNTQSSDYESFVFFGRWCEGVTQLIQVLTHHNPGDVHKTIVSLAEEWAESFSDRLPGPISLVKQWVEIQIMRRKDGESMDDGVTTLFETLTQSHNEVSRKKILQQELLFYVQMQDKDPEFCKAMQTKIQGLLEKDGHGQPIEWLKESRCFRMCGVRGVKYSIQYLSQAIRVCTGPLLAVAHCLRSLCTEDDEPDSEQVFKDIQSALDVWLALTSDGSMMPEYTMKILYAITDMLSLKGRIDYHLSLYEVMTVIYKRREVHVDELLNKLGEFRRLSHALCPSPVLVEFMSLPDVSGSQALKVFFDNSFSASQSSTTVDNFLTQLNSSASESDSYMAGNLCYDLCESLVSNGRLLEALPYALKAHHLREGLLKKFPFSFEERGKSIASELWCFDKSSYEWDDNYISPWLALQLHVESILQVGIIHEILGDGAEAKRILERGKLLSRSHNLTMFNIVFSSCLGKLYCKKKDWASADEQLQSAKKLLQNSTMKGFCPKCKVMLEVTVEHSLLDLNQSCPNGKLPVVDQYKQALSKLNSAEWKKSITCPEDQDCAVIVHDGSSQALGSFECETCSKEELAWDLDLQNCVVLLASDDVPCMCTSIGCLHCHTAKAKKSGLVNDYIKLKWELAYRRLSLKLLLGLGKCLVDDNQIDEACDITLQSISMLVGAKPFFSGSLPEMSDKQKHIYIYHLLGRETPTDVLSIERALLLHNLCWLSLKYREQGNRSNTHVVLSIPTSKLVSWLVLAFILCREVPALCQKVSRLLAAVFSLSISGVLHDALSTSCKDLSQPHWACFFHQVSLGIQFNYKLFIKEVGQHAETKGSCRASGEERLPRLAPESIEELYNFVKKFFQGLPCTPVICVTLLGHPYTSFLKETSSPSAPAWIMVSCLNPKEIPLHDLWPLPLPSKDDVGRTGESKWCCPWGPWGSSLVDIIAPTFRLLLEEDFDGAICRPSDSDDILDHKLSIDMRLSTLLKNLEDSWFDNKKHLLLGASVQPLILVPDFDIQMLPWESLPVLRRQEVYRMPSVMSIIAAYRNNREINPMNAYYLLNPESSIGLKIDFETCFSKHNLKGNVGFAPKAEELAALLESNDFFIYIGHNDGSQYIANEKIEGLQHCAGALLMGCRSASLKLDGCYIPNGAPLSYLFAGSPFLMGNLWDVPDAFDHFTNDVLESCFRANDQKQSLAACMIRAREHHKIMPYLVGASPVIYGVPRELGSKPVGPPRKKKKKKKS